MVKIKTLSRQSLVPWIEKVPEVNEQVLLNLLSQATATATATTATALR